MIQMTGWTICNQFYCLEYRTCLLIINFFQFFIWHCWITWNFSFLPLKFCCTFKLIQPYVSPPIHLFTSLTSQVNVRLIDHPHEIVFPGAKVARDARGAQRTKNLSLSLSQILNETMEHQLRKLIKERILD